MPPSDANGIVGYRYRQDGGSWVTYWGASAVSWKSGLADGESGLLEVVAIDGAGWESPIASATLTADYGPRVIAHTPDGQAGAVDSLTITFDSPIDPDSLRLTDVVLRGPTAEVLDTVGGLTAYDVDAVGGIVYVASSGGGLQIYDASDPADLVRLGGYDTPQPAMAVAVRDGLAYVTCSTYDDVDYIGSLVILDVSDPSAPALVGSCEAGLLTGSDITLTGTLACVADGTRLVVFDVADPSAPTVLSTTDMPNIAMSLAASGDTVYVSATYPYRSGRTTIVDLADPAHPVVRGDLTGSGRLAVEGDRLYLADSLSGLYIYDIADAAAPVFLGRGLSLQAYSYDVAVTGSLVYVVQSSSLKILDVSDPTMPLQIDSGAIGKGALRVVAGDGGVYVAGSSLGLQSVRTYPAQDVLAVTALDETTIHVDLAAVLPAGDYQAFLRPHVTDLTGQAMDSDADGVCGEFPQDTYSFSFSTDLPENYVARRGLADGESADMGIVPLRPGQMATTGNASTDLAGIARLVVDIAGLADPADLSPATMNSYFALRVGLDADLATWADAPDPTDLIVQPGAGVNGSDPRDDPLRRRRDPPAVAPGDGQGRPGHRAGRGRCVLLRQRRPAGRGLHRRPHRGPRRLQPVQGQLRPVGCRLRRRRLQRRRHGRPRRLHAHEGELRPDRHPVGDDHDSAGPGIAGHGADGHRDRCREAGLDGDGSHGSHRGRTARGDNSGSNGIPPASPDIDDTNR